MLLYQPQDGYCYNSDTLFLYDFASRFTPKGSVLDVGSGCGVLGLLVARDEKRADLSMVEKQESFAKLCEVNARVNGIKASIYHQDFLSFDEAKKFDFVLSNPPFYHDGVQKSTNEMISQARYSQNLDLASFFAKVARVLKPSSHFLFCYDAKQFGLICKELAGAKMRAVDVRFVHPKEDRPASLVMVHARANSKSMMQIDPPLFASSLEAKEIYKKADTQSIKCQI
ncbi:MAG: methyltransferase [Sulfuricurvum sp.]